MRTEDFALELETQYMRPLLDRYDSVLDDGFDFSEATKCMMMVLSSIRVALALNIKGPFNKALSDLQQIEMDMTAEILQLPHIKAMRKKHEKDDSNE